MREFVNTMKQRMRVSKDELFIFSGIAFFGGLAGIVLALILMNMNAMDDSYGTIGAVMALTIGVLMSFFVEIHSLQQDFNLAVSFGKTRKHYIPARFVFTVVNSTFGVVTVAVIGFVEHFLYSVCFPERECGFDLLPLLLHPISLMGILFLFPAITLAGGACLLKFGAKCGWVYWAIWMLGCIGFPKMMQAMEEEKDSVLKRIAMSFADIQLSYQQAAGGMLILGVAALAVAYMILKKQRVTA